ncbi:MAG: GntR family transcriptional regulator / MocR family aminotransferase [Solirubrobacteraceae bacterium]|nr:GntR family transcriptional regulator / MocR family aminotransferase [Solirubrobacteraceae bacterium]
MASDQTNLASAADAGFPADLLVALDRSAGRGVRRQLEGELRRAIRQGRLAIGTALPPSRVLAGELGVARGAVVDAYAQLAAEGYLEARQGSGTRVRAAQPRATVTDSTPPAPRPGTGPRLLGGLPDPASFPRTQWQRHYRAAIGALPTASVSYPDPRGEASLREALARYLGRVRAVVTAPDRIQVCGGFTQGLALVCRALLARGERRVAVEDPCFGYHRELIANAGLEPVPIRVDEHGIDTDELARHDVGAVLVAPAHSYPMGAVLAPHRRIALVEWADAADALVIEDDYDAEFRYDRAPIGALQGLRPERVVYGGSVSKTVSPILRVGWLAAPEALMADLRREKLYDDIANGTLDQLALARFLDAGDLARHLRRVRPLYRGRRDVALDALARHLPDATAAGVAAGLHLFVRLPDGCDERALVRAARRRGVVVEGTARHWADPATAPPALVLGYGAAGEAAIERGVATLGEAYAAAVV